MIRKMLLLLGITMAVPASSFAWVGGPFDGGSYSVLIERNGVYQATMTFKNGSGYAYWTPDNTLIPATTSSFGAGGSTLSSDRFSTSNRSIVYFQGLTYVGTATGTSDIQARQVTCYTNGFSEFTSTTTSSGSSGSLSSSSTIVSNTGYTSYAANTYFTAKITDTAPQIRFSGSGQLSIVSPDDYATAAESISDLITENYQSLIDSILENNELLANELIDSADQPVDNDGDGLPDTVTSGGEATVIDGTIVISGETTELLGPDGYFSTQELATVMEALDSLNANSQNSITGIIGEAATDLIDTLNPPSATEAANSTIRTPLKVYGLLRQF